MPFSPVSSSFSGTVYTVQHLRNQEQQAEATARKARVTDIVLKTASGSVQPRWEILIKPQVSGIVRRVLVEAGDAARRETCWPR